MSQNLLEYSIFCNNILLSVLVLKVRKETNGDLIYESFSPKSQNINLSQLFLSCKGSTKLKNGK